MKIELSGADEENLIAKLNQMSARQEFPEGDPRAGPFGPKEVHEADRYRNAAGRWSRNVNADLFAVRLQYGRGVSRMRSAAMFGLGDSIIQRARHLTGRRKWIPNMSERDRQNLARLVWLGGLLRDLLLGLNPDNTRLAMLKTASEWKRVETESEAVWLPEDEYGEAGPMTINTEISDDDYGTERDPYRDERAAMWARLEDEIDALEAAADQDHDADALAADPVGDAQAGKGADEDLCESA